MLELANGRLIETQEERDALRDVLAWWKSDCGWGRVDPEIDPAPPQSDQPGIDKINTEVTLSPSRRRVALGQCYGLNSKGNKSHRPTQRAIVDASQPGEPTPERL
jgi:hypothetical protein